MYSIQFSDIAVKALRKMPKKTAIMIRSKIASLAVAPYATNANVKKLRGRDGYRLRGGDWRVLYDLDDAMRILDVIDIGPRGGIYQ